ncbi:hypothetical protein C7451_101417 [Blastomonas natatoria]|uniref:DUF3108 domain-containing protein n=1 Tax=Blastomonas natatoria TaxID=34015 RepID=A0A2V3VC22_9SPHN|nr:hypothetical protein [Blastomonas natatoria]PXW79352.1 hypothetical protein C7451_101417 [Blastomonas natatoria]
MKKLGLLALPLTLLALPAAAHAAEPEEVTFEHDGDRYVYTVKRVGDLRIIDGTETRSGKRFTLRVSNKRVTGTVGDSKVRFSRSAITPLADTETTSDR